MKVSQEWLFGRIEEFLAQGQDVEVMIEGISMNPLLRSGKDAVVLSSVNCCRHCERSSPEHNLNKVPNLVKVKVGDIILFRTSGGYICHRITAQRNGVYITQGDGVCNKCETVAPDAVIAIVSAIIRPNGKRSSPNSRAARAYWRLWRLLTPFRRTLLAVLRRFFGRK